MDINDLRSIYTLVSFIAFIGIVWWVMSKRNQRGYDEAANLPFIEEATASSTGHPEGESR